MSMLFQCAAEIRRSVRTIAASGHGLHASVKAKSAMGAWTVTTGGMSVLRSVETLVSVLVN